MFSPPVRLGLFYGAYFLAVGVMLPYWPVWLEGRGMSPEQIGAVLAETDANPAVYRFRGDELYVFADADTHIDSGTGLRVIRLPEHYGALSPLLHVVPLQLLAYHTACARGTDVDKPRNLAKSVTVE